MKGAERIYVYPEFTHSCTERGKGDVEYIRADIVEEMIADAERYRLLKDICAKSVGVTLMVNDEALVYEEPNEEGVYYLQWYPNTPVCFSSMRGDSLDEVLDTIKEEA